MIYEMRVYEAMPGRLPDVLRRIETKALPLWEKHGIKQAGFFTTVAGEHNLHVTYFIAWDSFSDREKKWDAFTADPEWVAARAEANKSGPMIARVTTQFLTPTAFSSVQ